MDIISLRIQHLLINLMQKLLKSAKKCVPIIRDVTGSHGRMIKIQKAAGCCPRKEVRKTWIMGVIKVPLDLRHAKVENEIKSIPIGQR